MVAPASARKLSLRSGTILVNARRLAATSFGPYGYRKPEMMTEARNFSVPVPALPASARIGPASGFRYGASWRRADSRLTDAISQYSCSVAPMTGQSLTLSGGVGMVRSPDVS